MKKANWIKLQSSIIKKNSIFKGKIKKNYFFSEREREKRRRKKDHRSPTIAHPLTQSWSPGSSQWDASKAVREANVSQQSSTSCAA